ncbi:MAG: hypothetical protein QM674_11300 [Burkholderiaceae bacterium]
MNLEKEKDMHRTSFAAAIGLILIALAAPFVAVADDAKAPVAAQRLNAAGSEQRMLEREVGTYDVTATLYPPGGGAPMVSRGLVATRVMIGPFLQETMRPAPGSDAPDFTRLDYLNFDRVEGRWKYVSMDTRFPVSIMPASSFGPAEGDAIRVVFAPQAFVGFGPDVDGRFMVSDMTIRRLDDQHEIKEQQAGFATGDGRPRLFVRYEYTRRP